MEKLFENEYIEIVREETGRLIIRHKKEPSVWMVLAYGPHQITVAATDKRSYRKVEALPLAASLTVTTVE